MKQNQGGMLYLCATPIGNLEDITLRVIRVLGECDLVLAEDTRRTLQLLNHLGIKKPLMSCHQHNERHRCEEVLARVKAGEQVCLLSDAGMPGISDPGAALLSAAVEADAPVTVLPGASAALSALVLSGLPGERFAFEGFLPADKSRKKRLQSLAQEQRTLVFYEAPHRLLKTLRELFAALGERDAAVLRELTKLHEQALRMPLGELIAHFEQTEPRGECVIVVAGAQEAEEAVDEALLLATAKAYMADGLRLREAAQKTALELGAPYRMVYRLALRHSDGH